MKRMLRVLAVITAFALTAWGQATPAPPRKPAAPLPRDITPVDLALAGDGGLWMTQEYGDVLRIAPDGAVKPFDMRDELFTADIAAGPDGTIWVAGDQRVFQFDAGGKQLRRLDLGQGIPRTLARSGDAMWILFESSQLLRMDAAGAHREPIRDVPSEILGFNDMTGAPDGSVWFTETDYDDGSWIGRRAPDGRYSHSKLPRNLGEPREIAAGPDGAAWFTGRHALGRVDAGGLVTRFQLARRRRAAGHRRRPRRRHVVHQRRLPRADHRHGCDHDVAGPEGRAARGSRGGRRRQLLARRPCRECAPHAEPGHHRPRRVRSADAHALGGHDSAVLSFQVNDRFDDVTSYTDLRLRLTRNGQELFHETVPKLQGNAPHSDSKSLIVRDLDGDGEPEVLLTLNWNGNGCCSWSRIYRYERGTYVPLHHFWGDGGAEPVVRDLDGDGLPELRSFDDRFSHKYVYRGTARPLQIWSYRKGRLRDVTRRYPDLVSRDAARSGANTARTAPPRAGSFPPGWPTSTCSAARRSRTVPWRTRRRAASSRIGSTRGRNRQPPTCARSSASWHGTATSAERGRRTSRRAPPKRSQ